MLLTVIQTEIERKILREDLPQPQPERICDIKDCHNKAAGFVKFPAPPLPMGAERNKNSKFKIEEFALVAVCHHHYKEMMSEEGLDKAFDMKDNVYAQAEGIHN